MHLPITGGEDRTFNFRPSKHHQAAAASHRFLSRSDTFTKPISTGTSTKGPMTATKASPEFKPNTAMATAMAISKLLEAAVKDRVADCS